MKEGIKEESAGVINEGRKYDTKGEKKEGRK